MSKPSATEGIKARSNFLRGSIAEGLRDQISGALADDDTQLTKFHGVYQQDDRDLRPERAKKKLEKAFIFMARLRVPGGMMTPVQWLAMERVARECGNDTLRLTTRQTIQFHGIIKGNLRPAIRGIHAAMLDTIAACGDVNRNVIAATDPQRTGAQAGAAALALRLGAHLLPKSRAWHEIWIDGEQVAGDAPGAPQGEPIYGPTYMPRKFKIAIAVPPTNDVDVFAHDLGFITIEESGRCIGYNVVVGGGMGMTHGEPDTFPRIGDVIGFCTEDEAVDVAEKVVTIQRDWGDRSDRKHARLKYTIERAGIDRFVAELASRRGAELSPARPYAFARSGDALGWIDGDDGRWHFALYIENGRVGGQLLASLHRVAEAHRGHFILTPNQNLIIAGIAPEDRAAMAALLETDRLANPVSGLRRNAIACVALPTCGLALAESERALPGLLTKLEQELARHGLSEGEITIRMTGCPNGCARPYLAEIGIVGRGPGTYHVYLGGAFDGTRMNKLYRRDLTEDGIVAALLPLFASYAAERREGERFSDFVIRTGVVAATTAGNRFHEDVADAA